MKPVHLKNMGVSIALLACLTPFDNQALAQCFPVKPLATALQVTSPFGMRMHPTRNEKMMHKGVDLRARTPLPMYAVADGKVFYSDFQKGGGNVLMIRHNDLEIGYWHASSLIKKQGDVVRAGDLVAYSGNTGEWTSGPHLHFTVKLRGTVVDPLTYLCDASLTPSGGAIPPPPGSTGTATPTAEDLPPLPEFPYMDDRSMRDFLYTQTHKRFANPQWFLEMENPNFRTTADPSKANEANGQVHNPKIYMLRELNVMMAISNLLKEQLHGQRINTEAQLAAIMSINARNYAEKIQAMTASGKAIGR